MKNFFVLSRDHPPCHSEQRSDEESKKPLSKGMAFRFLAVLGMTWWGSSVEDDIVGSDPFCWGLPRALLVPRKRCLYKR